MPATSASQWKLDIRYVAGVFDGEGHVTVPHDLKHLQVGLTNGHKPLLELLMGRFGGSICSLKRQCVYHSPMWAWRLYNHQEQGAFLRAVEPHALVKVKAIRCGLLYLSTCKPLGGDRRVVFLSPAEWDKRKQAREGLRLVNAQRNGGACAGNQ